MLVTTDLPSWDLQLRSDVFPNAGTADEVLTTHVIRSHTHTSETSRKFLEQLRFSFHGAPSQAALKRQRGLHWGRARRR